MIDAGAIIRALHDGEINGGLTWFYDGEWFAWIGDRLNGIAAEATFNSIDAAAEWLRAKAIELYPDSEFAKAWRRGFE